MNLTMTIPRPVAATLLLGLILGGAGLVLSGLLVDLSASYAERSAKDEFIARSAPAGALRKSEQEKAQSLSVEADSETLAAAALDGIVRATVLDAGGTVSSSRAEAKHDEGDLPGKIEEVAEIGASNEALQTILFKFESGAPMIRVDAITVQPATTANSDETSAPTLRATMKLDAYWKRRAP